MESENNNMEDGDFSTVSPPGGARPTRKRKSSNLTFVLIGIGLLIVFLFVLSLTGIFKLNFTVGGYSIEELIVTDELDSNNKPAVSQSETVFEPTGRIYAAVYTSGVDSIVGFRWFKEEELLFERFVKTQDNYVYTYIEPAPNIPLQGGQYRVEVFIGGPKSPPNKTVHFTVESVELEVVPPYPTPEGHVDIENSPGVEVPFAFDELWEIDGNAWKVNEVKIVFLTDAQLFVVVVESDLNFADYSEEELEALTRPIAQYAVERGYWEQARQIEIDGQRYGLEEPMAITLFNPATGQGYRTRFEAVSFQ